MNLSGRTTEKQNFFVCHPINDMSYLVCFINAMLMGGVRPQDYTMLHSMVQWYTQGI